MADLDDPLPNLDIQTVVPDLTEKALKRRRLFNFNSQETPEVEPLFTDDQRPDVLSPNTLHNAATQAVRGIPTEPLGKPAGMKGRKRPAKKNQDPPSMS